MCTLRTQPTFVTKACAHSAHNRYCNTAHEVTWIYHLTAHAQTLRSTEMGACTVIHAMLPRASVKSPSTAGTEVKVSIDFKGRGILRDFCDALEGGPL